MAYTVNTDGTLYFSQARSFTPLAMDNDFKPKDIIIPDPTVVKQLAKTGKYKWWDKSPDSMSTNQYPTVIANALAGSSAAAIALETVCVYTYGRGVGVYERSVSEDGKEKITPVIDEKHLLFFIQNNVPDYLIKTITDYWTYARYFTSLVKNKGGDAFAGISAVDAPFCRLGYQNEDTGYIDNVYINGNWALMPSDKDCTEVPLLDRYNYANQLEKNKSAKRWMFSGYSYSPGVVYYHKHPWHSALDTGVLDLSPEIPRIRKNRFQRSLFIKYHVEIEERYWQATLGDKKYAELLQKPDELAQIKKDVYDKIDSKLGGTDNAFKSLFTGKETDRNGNTVSYVKITKIETDYGDSAAFDPDKMSNTADIFLAFGIPAPIMNTVLSDSKSRGGGSDVREGIIAFQQRLKWHRDNILAALEFVMRYNKLIKPSQFLAFTDIVPTTLDENPTGSQKTVA